MANVFDVAKYILSTKGNMTAMRLQKLCFYSQAWNLVWLEAPLFNEEIEAWAGGPVIPQLYGWHRGQFIVNINDDLINNCNNDLNDNEIDTINCVLRDYGEYTAQELSDLTHQEKPWQGAYENNKDSFGRCNTVISLASIHEYYSGLQANEQ